MSTDVDTLAEVRIELAMDRVMLTVPDSLPKYQCFDNVRSAKVDLANPIWMLALLHLLYAFGKFLPFSSPTSNVGCTYQAVVLT